MIQTILLRKDISVHADNMYYFLLEENTHILYSYCRGIFFLGVDRYWLSKQD